MTRRGELALVLHTHMPYVEGFGTWPFGEEWLWEAIATCYLPLLGVLGRAPITLSLTPVLCDQLEADGALDRCLQFLEKVRPESHRRDAEGFAARGDGQLAEAIERSAEQYAAAARQLRCLDDGLLGALEAHASWTSAATHAVLPLLATDSAISLQIQTGIASHRRRFGEWAGGFWLPECAYAPWLSAPLEEVGVRATCVEIPGHRRPLATPEGPVLWPIDRQAISLVWSASGYPSGAAYRNYHGLTEHHHRVWRNDGAPYDESAALAQAATDARDFVARVRERVADGGICVCAIDTELLGHWWYEGVSWLAAVIEESALQGLELTSLDDALERHEPEAVPRGLGVSTWGHGGDLRTWSGPCVADLAYQARSAELELAALGGRPNDRALRELLALQASDWAFLATEKLAGEYPRERARGHAEGLRAALGDGAGREPMLRNLAPQLAGWGS
jgi:1,4-alpha-glucan branching enzyme